MGRCVLCRVGVWKSTATSGTKKETASRSVMTASGTLRSIQGETCGSGRSKRGIPSLFLPSLGRRIPYFTFDHGPVGNYSVWPFRRLQDWTLWIATWENAYWLSLRSRVLPRDSLPDDLGRLELFLTIEKDHERRLWFSSAVSDFVTAIDIPTLRALKRMKTHPRRGTL